MRVIHVITGLGDGGAEAVLYRLCKSDRVHHHIVISLLDKGKYGSLLEELGVPVYVLNMTIGFEVLLSLYRLRKLIKGLKPDAIQTWMLHGDLFGGLAGRLAGVRNITWGVHHTDLLKGESRLSTIIIAKINALISGFIPKNIIYCAKKSQQSQESIGYRRSKAIVVPNGYDVSDFQPDTEQRGLFRKEIGLKNEVFVIGHVGRLSPYKDYPNLSRAFAYVEKEFSDARFIVVGADLKRGSFEVERIGFSKNVELLGPRTDMPFVMNGIDLFVLSSNSEAFPNVINEAMACGTPCVTTDVGDSGFIVGETGWIVPPKDPHALATAIAQAIHEKQQSYQSWLNRKKACRDRTVENFSIKRMIDGYHKVWAK